ncbi:isopentenyl-diphosphate Delta-isomerase [Nocardioides marinquilinus]|uniref:Isopentenyl-diphosphate Delta-isomerase n=1 Tax=Nocardioides marinquilinus TaxID=1210400 RepID=A0ABP9PI58_9ACTN
MPETADLVVLLDDDGAPIGTAPREGVHTTDTPLHLAFSCHLVDDAGRTLVSRRALGKRSWPGVWTNSFCGHPRPDEAVEDAVRRHGRHELGIEVSDLAPLLPEFRYRAVDAAGVVENEVCPVFSARLAPGSPDPAPNPDEVAELAWVEVDDLLRMVERTPWALSPWLVGQVEGLRRLARVVQPGP